MGRRHREETDAGLWRVVLGEYGHRVTLRELEKGGPVRMDYREPGGKRVRESTGLRVRERGRIRPELRDAAVAVGERKAARLKLDRLRQDAAPEAVTVEAAYALYFHPERGGLPASKASRTHHNASRDDWTRHFGKLYGTPALWNRIRPADVEALAFALKRAGKVPTATKRVENLRAVHRWLVERAGFEGLRNPVRGFPWKRLREGYEPRRPRNTAEVTNALIEAAPEIGPHAGPKMRLLLTWVADSGARIGQVRTVMRSQVDRELQPPPPDGLFPHGWVVLVGVKGQRPVLWPMTRFARHEWEVAAATWLRDAERAFTEDGMDYAVFSGGKLDELDATPVSDRGARDWLDAAFNAAGIERKNRQSWHSIRREVSDAIYEAEGLDVLTSALGWHSRDTPAEIYISAERYKDLARSRDVMEQRRQGE